MTSSGIFINSQTYSSGFEYDGRWVLSNDVQGYYGTIYTHLEDGDVPICYEGVNALSVMRTSNSAVTVIHFDDLSSDTGSDVETWLEAGFGDLFADIGVNITSATAESDGTYSLVFDESVTLRFSQNSSSLSKLFGTTDLTGTDISLSGININNRPKYLGVCISEANQIYAGVGSNEINCLISGMDDLVKGIVIYLPNESNALNIKIVRLNAPSVAVPINLRWSLVLQKNFGPGF